MLAGNGPAYADIRKTEGTGGRFESEEQYEEKLVEICGGGMCNSGISASHLCGGRHFLKAGD